MRAVGQSEIIRRQQDLPQAWPAWYLTGAWCLMSAYITITHRIHVCYMVTFTINIPQMLAYIYHTWILWVMVGQFLPGLNGTSIRVLCQTPSRARILAKTVAWRSRLGPTDSKRCGLEPQHVLVRSFPLAFYNMEPRSDKPLSNWGVSCHLANLSPSKFGVTPCQFAAPGPQ